MNHPITHVNNPRYKLTLEHASDVLVELKGPKQFLIGFDIYWIPTEGGGQFSSHPKKSSGNYR